MYYVSVQFVSLMLRIVQRHRIISKTVGGTSCPALNAFTVVALRFYMSHLCKACLFQNGCLTSFAEVTY